MSKTQPNPPHQYTDGNRGEWKSENELFQRLMETLGDLDSSQTCILLSRMNSLADSMRSMRCRGNYRKAGVELSDREGEVLVLISHGYTRRDIAQSLGITANTASRHISNIYNKLGISCVAEATAFALRHNMTGSGDQL